MRRSAVLLSTLLGVFSVSCGGQLKGSRGCPPAVRLVSDSTRQELNGHFSLLHDPTGAITIQQVLALSSSATAEWRICEGAQANFGYTPDTYWVHIVLANEEGRRTVRILELPGTLESIDLYSSNGLEGGRHERTGKKVPFSARPFTSGELAFRVVLENGGTEDLWLRIASRDTLFVYPVLWSDRRFANEVSRRDLVSAAYAGALLAMALFNLFIWVSLRDKAYLYYALFQIAVIFVLGAGEHSSFKYLWPESPEWASRSENVFVGPAVSAAAGFARSFLGKRYLTFWSDRILRLTMGLGVVLSMVAIFTDAPLLEQTTSLLVVLTCAVIFGSGLVAMMQGSPNGRVFVVAWFVLLSSGVLAASTTMGLLGWHPLLVEGPRLGSTIEAILLSFGLARRIKLANREKDEAQQRAVDLERAQAQVLERRVSERTCALEQALNSLRSAQDRMMQQARPAALGHLISGVAHEIGNPLNFVIGGATELSKRLRVLQASMPTADDGLANVSASTIDEALRGVALIENGSGRIHRIVETLRDYTRTRTDTREWVNLASALDATLALIRPMTDRQDIQLIREFDISCAVMSRPVELGQVFLNLLLNSCQALPGGGTISMRIQTVSNGSTEIEFSDTGPGILPEHRDFIFNPFFTTRMSEGTGLGLSLSRRIVEDHGGELKLRDADRGATFVVLFPKYSGTPLELATDQL